MKTKHSKGPWFYTGERFKHDNSAVVGSSNGKFVAAALDFNRSDLDEEVVANAHLIAAGPQMLEAMIELDGCNSSILQMNDEMFEDFLADKMFVTNEIEGSVLRKFRAAMLKALGETR